MVPFEAALCFSSCTFYPAIIMGWGGGAKIAVALSYLFHKQTKEVVRMWWGAVVRCVLRLTLRLSAHTISTVQRPRKKATTKNSASLHSVGHLQTLSRQRLPGKLISIKLRHKPRTEVDCILSHQNYFNLVSNGEIILSQSHAVNLFPETQLYLPNRPFKINEGRLATSIKKWVLRPRWKEKLSFIHLYLSFGERSHVKV